jgi:NDP-sugar pyrophosphorylase family protein
LQAVVLAAGTGSRIMPVTRAIPKALFPITNRPLLEHVVRQLEHAGIREIIVVTGHLGQKIRESLGEQKEDFKADISYISADDYAKGPIFSLLAAEKKIQDEFLLTPVDLILAASIIPKLLANRSSEDSVTIAVDSRFHSDEGTPILYFLPPKSDLGSVLSLGPSEIRGATKLKSRTRLGTSVGIAVCPAGIFKQAHTAAKNGSTRVVDALNLMISQNEKGRCVLIGTDDYWFDVDTVETALSANRLLLHGSLFGDKPRGKLYTAQFVSKHTGESTGSRVSPARIIGPSIIAEGSEIGDGSRIGPYVSIQEECVIGRDVSCRNSIMLKGSKIDDYTSIRDAITYDHKTISAQRSNNVTPDQDAENEGQ